MRWKVVQLEMLQVTEPPSSRLPAPSGNANPAQTPRAIRTSSLRSRTAAPESPADDNRPYTLCGRFVAVQHPVKQYVGCLKGSLKVSANPGTGGGQRALSGAWDPDTHFHTVWWLYPPRRVRILIRSGPGSMDEQRSYHPACGLDYRTATPAPSVTKTGGHPSTLTEPHSPSSHMKYRVRGHSPSLQASLLPVRQLPSHLPSFDVC